MCATGPSCGWAISLDGEGLGEGSVVWEGGVGQVEAGVDGFKGSVEVAFPEGDVVFVCREVCERVRDCPVFF